MTRAQKRKLLRIELACFALALIVTAIVIVRDYRARPGFMERDSIRAVRRGTSSITLEWDRVRNTDTYVLFYKQKGKEYTKWSRVEMDSEDAHVDEEKASAKVKGLEEGTEYVFVIRADSEEREGFETKGKTFSTRIRQHLSARQHMTKLTCSKPFRIDAGAKTDVTYETSDEDVIGIDKKGRLVPAGSGSAEVTVRAASSKKYAKASIKINIDVIYAESTGASGSSARIIGELNEASCTAVKAVSGDGGIHVPQGLGYSGDKYYIAYGMAGSQRIITFDVNGDGKNISVPSIALGHPNGFCYADSTGLCYCVKGWSGRCVTYSPETGGYDVITLPYGASGIAYDRKENLFYTSSRTAMVSYSGDGSFKVQRTVGVVSHSGNTYTQDCGGHAGIMMRVLSGSTKHGTNYVDLYDMKNGNYLGSFACELSEVESAVCDEDGYMLLLANNSSKIDYIWKTNINIEDIGAGL